MTVDAQGSSSMEDQWQIKEMPPMDQNLLNLMHFFEKSGNLYVDAPVLGMELLLWGILVRFHS